MPFTLATWNILADAYIKPEYYPFTAARWFDPESRWPRLVETLAELNVDLACLQEVEDETFAVLREGLTAHGYQGQFAPKGRNRPDGCAAFWRTSRFVPDQVLRLEYDDSQDAQGPSGHIAQILVVRYAERFLGIANTHIRWDPANTPRARKIGVRQVRQLLEERQRLAPECAGWIICGDFNATPTSDVIAEMRSAGMESSHRARPRDYTANAHRKAKVIDFLFHDANLRSDPQPVAPINDRTPLPGPGHPSDHVPVVATFEWSSLPSGK
jgi:mRNA deadenylase 3'-5' endonuclease subunit Ccr4